MINSAHITNDEGEYVIAGQYASSVGINGKDLPDIGKDNADIFVLKNNSLGEIDWLKTFGGDGKDRATCIIQTTDGDFILSIVDQSKTFSFDNGTEIKDEGNQRAVTVRLSNKGETKAIYTIQQKGETCYNTLEPTSDGGYLVGGSFRGGDVKVSENRTLKYEGVKENSTIGMVLKYNKDNELEWAQDFKGKDANVFFNNDINSITQTQDNGCIVSFENNGSSIVVGNKEVSLVTKNSHLTALVKLNKSGELEWIKQLNFTYTKDVVELANEEYLSIGYIYNYMEDSSVYLKLDNEQKFDKERTAILVKYKGSYVPVNASIPTTSTDDPSNSNSQQGSTNGESSNGGSNNGGSSNAGTNVGSSNVDNYNSGGYSNSGTGSSGSGSNGGSNGYDLNDYYDKAAQDKIDSKVQVSGSPHTGDMIIYFVLLLIVSGVGIIVIMRIKNKRNKKETGKEINKERKKEESKKEESKKEESKKEESKKEESKKEESKKEDNKNES